MVCAKRPEHRSFPGKSWVINGLRALHLGALVAFASVWLNGGGACGTACTVLIGSGLAIVALDWWSNPAYWAEWKGLAMAIKLVAAFWLLRGPTPEPVFWALLVLSVLISHAPGRLRNRRWLGRN